MRSHKFRWSLISVCLLMPLSLRAAEFPLRVIDFREINFEGIPRTEYKFDSNSLSYRVSRSASALLNSFESIKEIKEVSFEWRVHGELKVKDAQHEASKDGDDAILRIGLLVSGKAPMVPFFAPKWIKQTRKSLKFPSDKMVYLTVSAKHEDGQSWNSPYSDSIRSIALGHDRLKDEWNRSTFQFPKKVKIVGLWIMADGDNTKSEFAGDLRNLRLE